MEFNLTHYYYLNKDLNNLNKKKLIEHYKTIGINENRKCNIYMEYPDFDYIQYKKNYTQLKLYNKAQLEIDWLRIGRYKNRTYYPVNSIKSPKVLQEVSPVLPELSPVLPEVSPVLPELSPVLPEVSPVLPEVSPVSEVSPVLPEVSPVSEVSPVPEVSPVLPVQPEVPPVSQVLPVQPEVPPVSQQEKNKEIIYIDLFNSCGFGNLLFIVCNGLALSLEYSRDIKFLNYASTRKDRININNYNMFKNLNYINKIPNNTTIFKELNVFIYSKIYLENKNYFISGYFQSYKYFDKYLGEIKKILNIKKSETTDKKIILIHIRRGDYINLSDYHLVMTEDYYKNALDIYFKDKVKEEYIIELFTDDIIDVKKWKLNNYYKMNYINENDPEKIFYLMKRAHHFIIANSSLSLISYIFRDNIDATISFPPAWINNLFNYNDFIPDKSLYIDVSNKLDNVYTLSNKTEKKIDIFNSLISINLKNDNLIELLNKAITNNLNYIVILNETIYIDNKDYVLYVINKIMKNLDWNVIVLGGDNIETNIDFLINKIEKYNNPSGLIINKKYFSELINKLNSNFIINNNIFNKIDNWYTLKQKYIHNLDSIYNIPIVYTDNLNFNKLNKIYHNFKTLIVALENVNINIKKSELDIIINSKYDLIYVNKVNNITSSFSNKLDDKCKIFILNNFYFKKENINKISYNLNLNDACEFNYNYDCYILHSNNVKRREQFSNILNIFNIKFNIFYSIPDNNKIVSGAKSMLEIFKKILNKDIFTPTLILEDDINITNYYDNIIIPSDADCIYTGISKCSVRPNRELYQDGIPYEETNYKNLVKIKSMLSTHSFLITSLKYLHQLIDCMHISIKYGIHYDIPLARIMHKYNVYACINPVFYQDKAVGGQEEPTLFILDNKLKIDFKESEYNTCYKYFNKNITFSTCWYELNSKFDKSLYYKWINNFLSVVINCYLVIYTNNIDIFEKYKDNQRIKIIFKDFEDFKTYKYDWLSNHNNNTSLKHVDSKLVMLWNEKIHFVKESINYFNTEYYGWCDIGYFRNRKNDTNINDIILWPSLEKINKLDKNKIYYALINNNNTQINELKLLINNKNTNNLPIEPINENYDVIAGGFFITSKTKLKLWHNIFYNKLKLYFNNNYLIKDDQTIIKDCIFSNETKNNFILIDEKNNLDNWFLFQRFLL